MSEILPNEQSGSDKSSKASFRNKVIKGATWNIVQLFVSSGFKYVVQLILAYLIAPEAFGLIGMATVFTSIVDTINDLGLGPALIQKKNENLTEVHYSTVFWVSLGFAGITFIVMSAFISPMVAAFYEEEVLRPVIIVLCVPILLKPLTLIHRIKLTKEISFKPIALIESLGAVFGGLSAIIMACMGLGVWSIALQGSASALITIPAMWKVVRWKPAKVISKEAFKDTFNYGIFVMIKSIATTLMDNVDYLMIGKMMGSYYVGVYTFAFLLTDIVRKQIMGIMNRVMFPVYSKVQDQTEIVGRYYLRIIRYNTMILIPLMTIMLVFAEPIVYIFFEGKWKDSILPIQILSIAVMFHVATGTFSTVLMGIGKAKDDFIIYSIKNVLVYLPVVYFFISKWGIIGAASAVLIHKFVSFLANLILTKYYIKVNPINILKNVAPSVLSALALFTAYRALATIAGTPMNALQLIIYTIVLGCVYFATIYPFARNEIRTLLRWVAQKRNKSAE